MADAATPPKDDDYDLLKTIRERFSAAEEAHAENRKNWVDDVRFSTSADQWDEEVKLLRGKGRPALTFNRLNGVIKQIIGDYRQNKLAIKVLPASGDADEDTADILAGIIRNIEAQSNADMAYLYALESAARGGFGYFRILTRYTGDDVFDQDIVIEPIHNPLSVYFDPSARKITREDAKWCIITEVIPEDEFKRLYPDVKATGFEDGSPGDRWATENGVRIAEHYEKVTYPARVGAFSNGMVVEITDDSEIEALAQIGITLVREREAERTKIVWHKLTGSQVIETREYKIRYIPVIPVIGEEVNIEDKVYTRSAIYYAKDAQKMYNYWKTSATESVALASKAPWLVTPAHIEGVQDQWDNANNVPMPYMVYNPDPSAPPPQRLEPAKQPIGEMAMAMGTSTDIQYTTGVFDASLGAQGKEVSGVAIGERQNQGATSTFLFTDNLKKSIEYCGRVLMDFIPVVMDTERVVRILDLEGNPSTEVINQQKYNPMTGIVEVLNDITLGKYDVVIDTGPNFASRRREAQDAMLKIAQVWPQLMNIAPDLVIGTIDAPGMEAIAERAKRTLPPQITVDPESPEGQQLQQQMQQKQAQAEQTQNQLVQAHLATEFGKQHAEQAKAGAQVAKAQAEVVKAKADVIESAHQTRRAETDTALHALDALKQEVPAMTGTPQPTAPHQPHVVLQMNADDALSHVADHIKGVADKQAGTIDNMNNVMNMIAGSLAAHHKASTDQTAMLHQVLQHSAKSHDNVAHAIHTLAAVQAAPRKATRDPKTDKIIGSEIVIPNQ